MISVKKVFFEQVFMNITLWAWGRYGLAVSALILLGVPAVAAPSAIKISQGVSQQSGGNPTAAERAFTEADRLYQQGTAQSLRQAIAKWEEALKLYREAGDRRGEANTLTNIGQVYSDLEEQQKALEYYSQSLPLSRAVGDRKQEATILNSIGSACSYLGEKQKAREYFSQSLLLHREAGNRYGEATTLNNIGLVYLELGDNQKAKEYYSQSLPLFRSIGDRGWESTTL
ncbi:MAG: tetratricopeptide repeat protein, partial [Microcoleus sp. T1-bin1]|nr:tetratricopeptide repeat protein [Microcoleus sp. T1-bin1]